MCMATRLATRRSLVMTPRDAEGPVVGGEVLTWALLGQGLWVGMQGKEESTLFH